MAIALVSGQVYSLRYAGAGSTSWTVTFPSNTSANDVVILWITPDSDAGSMTITPPSGFTTITDKAATSFAARKVIMGKRCSAGENNFAITSSGNMFNIDYGGAAYSGCITSGTVWDVIGSDNNGFNTTPTALALTTLEDNELAIAIVNDSGAGTPGRSSPTSGWNNDVVVDTSGASKGFTDMWSKTIASTGTSGDFSATVSNWGWNAIQIALKPDTGGAVTGTIGASLIKHTASLSGTQKQTGTIGASLQKHAANLSGYMKPTGVIAAAMIKTAAALTGTHKQTGTIGAALIKMAVSLSGSQLQTGTIAANMQKLVFNATGVMVPSGVLSGALVKMQSSFSGTSVGAGSLNSTLIKHTISLTGTQKQTGVIASQLQHLIFAGTGVMIPTGTISAALIKMQMQASGASGTVVTIPGLLTLLGVG